jgi:hypothetical protein
MAVDGETAAPLKDGAKTRLTEVGIAHTPASGAADAFGEYGARLKQRDDFGQGIGQGWTLANELRTLHGRSSGYPMP